MLERDHQKWWKNNSPQDIVSIDVENSIIEGLPDMVSFGPEGSIFLEFKRIHSSAYLEFEISQISLYRKLRTFVNPKKDPLLILAFGKDFFIPITMYEVLDARMTIKNKKWRVENIITEKDYDLTPKSVHDFYDKLGLLA